MKLITLKMVFVIGMLSIVSVPAIAAVPAVVPPVRIESTLELVLNTPAVSPPRANAMQPSAVATTQDNVAQPTVVVSETIVPENATPVVPSIENSTDMSGNIVTLTTNVRNSSYTYPSNQLDPRLTFQLYLISIALAVGGLFTIFGGIPAAASLAIKFPMVLRRRITEIVQ